jgi:soluble lytic murein transglycosylase-like protein
MTPAFVVLLASAAAAAQDPRTAMEEAVAKQRASLDRQRESIRNQAHALQNAGSSFFTVPWSDALTPAAPVRECDPLPEEQIGPMVKEISRREGLTPDLLRAVIEKESAYLPCAVSSRGAEGLMQLMPDTAAELGVTNPFDARENVDGGARFLRQLLDRYGGDVVLALAAYNAGPRRVDEAGGVPPIPETLGYVSGILDKAEAF